MENEVKIADYIQRMIEEKKELDERIVKLVTFLYSDKSESINQYQKSLLNTQREAMERYSHVLGDRILNEKILTGVISPEPQKDERVGYVSCC